MQWRGAVAMSRRVTVKTSTVSPLPLTYLLLFTLADSIGNITTGLIFDVDAGGGGFTPFGTLISHAFDTGPLQFGQG